MQPVNHAATHFHPNKLTHRHNVQTKHIRKYKNEKLIQNIKFQKVKCERNNKNKKAYPKIARKDIIISKRDRTFKGEGGEIVKRKEKSKFNKRNDENTKAIEEESISKSKDKKIKDTKEDCIFRVKDNITNYSNVKGNEPVIFTNKIKEAHFFRREDNVNNFKIRDGIFRRKDNTPQKRQHGTVGDVCKRVNTKWRSHRGVIAALVLLNVTAQCGGVEVMSTSVLASLLGYPSTCTVSGDLRPCTLTLSCWLRGGTSLPGCGGWLFSCCQERQNYEVFDNSIVTSDWRYKSPPKLRQVPQRSVIPNNVFRRRVDDDVTQVDCGLPATRILQKRIIGGREARFAEFPWQAHVRISEFQCGGVLVSRRYVATAAHCVSRARVRDIAVWLGAHDTSAPPHDRTTSARKLGVIQKILHPLFQFRMTQPDRYDIALLKLARPITFMSHILPICLPDYDMDLRGRSGVIAGWGKTDASTGHTGTNMLRSATVPILSREQCINWHQIKQISVEIHSEMICAGHSDGHQDACLGDSGGPLIVLDNGRYYLVGITSAGFGCGVDHQPGIYHNVRLTADWIRHVISTTPSYYQYNDV